MQKPPPNPWLPLRRADEAERPRWWQRKPREGQGGQDPLGYESAQPWSQSLAPSDAEDY